MIAERFMAPAGLRQVHVPLAMVPQEWAGLLDLVVAEDATRSTRRFSCPIGPARAAGQDFAFPAFANEAAGLFTIVVAIDADGDRLDAVLAQADALTASRNPIELTCAGRPAAVESADIMSAPALAYGLELVWCDRSGLFLKGWLHAFGRAVSCLHITAGGPASTVHDFTPRPDVAAHFPAHPQALQCGFQAYVPWRLGQPIVLQATTDRGTITETAEFPADPHPAAARSAEGDDAFTRLIDESNARRFAVVEVGARKVSANWADMRAAFHGASRYVGMDIHPGPGVDLVGDAHDLAGLVGAGAVDAVFSLSVLEHLSHPWRFARSVAAALRVGGLTFHATHQTWPMHEEPNDFWRFSDEGLKTLFGPENGFEVLAAGMGDRLSIVPGSMRPGHLMMPLVSAFGQSFILARKLRDVLPVEAETGAAQLIGRAQMYPRRDG